MLRLAASTTGGARLRIPIRRDPFHPKFRHRINQKAPLCKGSWHGVAVTEWLPAKGNNFISPVGVAESPEGNGLHAYPAGGYFSVKKSNQKSLGEDPETPTRRYTPYNRGPRKVVRPCGERRMHRSGEGCPEQSAGSARLKRRLRPTRRRL